MTTATLITLPLRVWAVALEGDQDLRDIDKAQRAVAGSWEDNPRCNTESFNVDAVRADMGAASRSFCMAEDVVTFVARCSEKERLVEDAQVPWEDFSRLAAELDVAGAEAPEAYTFRQTQRVLGSDDDSSWPPVEEADVLGGLKNDCALLREASVPELAWQSVDRPVGSEGPDDGTSKLGASARQLLHDEGGLLLRGVLNNTGILHRLRKYLLQKAARPDASSTEYVHAAKHRHHLRLRPDEDAAVAAAWRAMVLAAAAVLTPLVSSLGTVVEFAAFLTNPGAAGQRLHSDSGNTFSQTQAPLYSLFLFLTDLDDATMGPLQLVPRSHALSGVRESTRWAVQHLARDGDPAAEMACTGHWRLCPVRAGDAALYDSTALHRGTANNSTRTRVVVYLTFLGVGELPFGQTFAIDNSLLQPPQRLGKLAATLLLQDGPYQPEL